MGRLAAAGRPGGGAAPHIGLDRGEPVAVRAGPVRGVVPGPAPAATLRVDFPGRGVGAAATDGAETVVTVELEPSPPGGTRLRLTHRGFYDRAGAARHDKAWTDHVLPHLDAVLSAS
ncbi:SRPBCC domain-containing protein [Streptomyces sp. NPDC059566]|uniref:SRPBCC domain-containing protein n=1 Tax=Streptomyces sp. NPDC059566 TaxID=3346866 RepID=UPI0036C394D5